MLFTFNADICIALDNLYLTIYLSYVFIFFNFRMIPVIYYDVNAKLLVVNALKLWRVPQNYWFLACNNAICQEKKYM